MKAPRATIARRAGSSKRSARPRAISARVALLAPGEQADVLELVQQADLGGRKPAGIARAFLAGVCIVWSLLQLWYASPLPFSLNVLILNDTEMRALHLALGL